MIHFDKTSEQIKTYLRQLQNTIMQAIEKADGQACFREDVWEKPKGGGGITCILENGDVFEQAGINFSHVYGKALPAAATKKNPALANYPFQAQGISLVFHPLNPYVPTTHANFRFFVVEQADQAPLWWFGGGYDLTPYYGFEEDARHWHQTAQRTCDEFDPVIYPRFKSSCDDYFYLKHRNETRGIGGLFFDDFNEWSFERCFAFIQALGNSFLDAYLPIVEKRISMPYGEKEKAFQLYRRGRYVEFNLLYDRGTLFGLQFGGRIESILMSLPPQVRWRYNWQPEPGTSEAKLYEIFLKPQDWATWT